MRRRMADFLFASLLLLMLPGTAAADRLTESITDQLRRQGYGEIVVSRTFLGRYRIVASTSKVEREIIVNPGSGEILRDYIEDKNDGRSRGGLFSLFDGVGGGDDVGGLSDDGAGDEADGDDGDSDGDDGGNGPGDGAGNGPGNGGAGGGEGHGGSGDNGDGDSGDGDD